MYARTAQHIYRRSSWLMLLWAFHVICRLPYSPVKYVVSVHTQRQLAWGVNAKMHDPSRQPA